ncbi:MAG: hypothetical protein IPM32_08990 [Ignavibacteriae bacterium]|nr:hypothetical protein [Ignavibacteriota bacterium]
MIIVPLKSSFGQLSQHEQNENLNALQLCASEAGLRGIVCLVWNIGSVFNFMAPDEWCPFFNSIDIQFVMMNINRELTCTNG